MKVFKLPDNITKIDRLQLIYNGLRIFKRTHKPWINPTTGLRCGPGIYIGQNTIMIIGRKKLAKERFYFDDLK